MANNEQKKEAKSSVGRIIGVILILLIVAVVCAPQLLFFLTPAQQEAVRLFHENYIGKFMPVRAEDGSFDWMRLVALAFMLAACWAVYRILVWIISLIRPKSRRGETVKGLVANIIRYAIVIFAIIFGLSILGADVLTVIAGLGILALVIGFGAQSLIEDIFAGLFILFEGRFFVGDIISVDGFRGEVKSIGIVSTQLKDLGGNIRIINNSDIRVLTNLSNVQSVAISIVSIAYGADLVKAEQVVGATLERLPQQFPHLFPSVPKYQGVETLNESSVDLKIVANVEEANVYNARRAMNRELKLALDAAGIEIPFPQVVVWQGKEK
ncbi:MAG: mechanosensitive ion channel family protein [Lachnospiraceae bacterium]|nr:mechanosensitive ion channel family protein [Lachnospiraceae bacterium]